MAGPLRYPVDLHEPADPDIPLPSAFEPSVELESNQSPLEDGGVAQHPLHDSDLDDMKPEDFEDELDPSAREQLPDMLPDLDTP